MEIHRYNDDHHRCGLSPFLRADADELSGFPPARTPATKRSCCPFPADRCSSHWSKPDGVASQPKVQRSASDSIRATLHARRQIPRASSGSIRVSIFRNRRSHIELCAFLRFRVRRQPQPLGADSVARSENCHCVERCAGKLHSSRLQYSLRCQRDGYPKCRRPDPMEAHNKVKNAGTRFQCGFHAARAQNRTEDSSLTISAIEARDEKLLDGVKPRESKIVTGASSHGGALFYFGHAGN